MKKLFCAVAMCFSAMNAHAGYIEYELSGPGLSTTGLGNSFIVMRDDDKSIAFYYVQTKFGYFETQEANDSYHTSALIDSSSNFWGLGPTNFHVKDIWQEDSTNTLAINFAAGDNPSTFNYTMWITTGPGPYSPYPDLVPTYDVNYTGTAVQVPVTDFTVYMLDNGQFVLPHTVPTQNVPEPGSLALIALGVMGMGRLRRRKD